MKKSFFLIIGILFFFSSCTSKKEAIEVSKEELIIIHLEDSLFQAENVVDLQQTLSNHLPLAADYFLVDSSNLPIFAEALYSMTRNENLKEFYYQSKEEQFFGSDYWEKDLKNLLGRIKTLYPEKKVPIVYTLFTGFGGGSNFSSPALMINDEYLAIGLDYFMGEKGKFIAPELYQYQLKRFSPQGMVSQIALEYAGLFNQHEKKNVNLLSDMIWAGKNYYFAKNILPKLMDSTLFGYSSKEIEDSEKFESTIWEHFVKNSLLYKEDELTKTKYMGDRPKTLEIGPACPGSIGRWLGYRIIDSYMKNHPEIELKDLMKELNINKLFRESGYQPNK